MGGITAARWGGGYGGCGHSRRGRAGRARAPWRGQAGKPSDSEPGRAAPTRAKVLWQVVTWGDHSRGAAGSREHRPLRGLPLHWGWGAGVDPSSQARACSALRRPRPVPWGSGHRRSGQAPVPCGGAGAQKPIRTVLGLRGTSQAQLRGWGHSNSPGQATPHPGDRPVLGGDTHQQVERSSAQTVPETGKCSKGEKWCWGDG